jgi:AcrR family transcriptional regulator
MVAYGQGMTEQLGLRERKKAAMRATISQAAVRLARQHGAGYVTVDTIAAAADVAPRTVRNYFSSPEEAVLAPLFDQASGFTDSIRSAPADEPLWDVLQDASIAVLSGPWLELNDLIQSSPGLMAAFLATCEMAEHRMAEVIAERLDLDARQDPYPRLVAGVFVLALKTAIEYSAAGSNAMDLPTAVRTSIDMVRAGLPEPARVVSRA